MPETVTLSNGVQLHYHTEIFELGDEVIGLWNIPARRHMIGADHDSHLTAPVSYAFFCPQCGVIWGRRIVDAHPKWIHLHHWDVMLRKCAAHGGDDSIFFGTEFEEQYQEMPMEFKKYGLNVLLNRRK